jgi:hypothetical protein
MKISLNMPIIHSEFIPRWSLTNETRSKKLEGLKSKGFREIFYLEDIDMWLLQSISNKNCYYIEQEGKLIYYLELTLVKLTGLVSSFSPSQAFIWRDRLALFSRGAVSSVFDFLYTTHSSILSDSVQSVAGFNFWYNEILSSLKLGRSIYVLKGESYLGPKPSIKVDAVFKINKLNELKPFQSKDPEKDTELYRFLILPKNSKLTKKLDKLI